MEMARRRGSSADLAAYTRGEDDVQQSSPGKPLCRRRAGNRIRTFRQLNLVGTPKWTFVDRPSSSRLPRIPRSGSGGSLVIPFGIAVRRRNNGTKWQQYGSYQRYGLRSELMKMLPDTDLVLNRRNASRYGLSSELMKMLPNTDLVLNQRGASGYGLSS
ncbi:hypothetical protein L1987_34271 [Smallanthus sonchifolius]|uniref:Uncharacterized protein n=1 Tax=Smallanthus sonchifolius TaxID=185202 RepID=A0ACB9HSM7_9ASTR|nr:hypothetical protein L1987_34271 [Smallanthus sonchifolius]